MRALFSRKDGPGKLCESSAVPLAFGPAACSFQAPLLSMLAARNTVGATEVGGAQVKKDGKVGRGVAGPESESSVVEFAAAMGINTPFMWALGHHEKPCAFATRVVQGTASCQVPRTQSL